jgi:negative regulator of sigma E activity
MQGDPLHSERKERMMRPKQIAITAAVALAVVIGFNAYAAKKG